MLTEADKNILDSAEIKSLKRILNLPEKTPTNAIRAITGTWTMGIRIQVRQLLYLKKILTRNCESNSKILLNALKERNIGWAKYITRVLNDFDLIDDWAEIQKINVPKWKKQVHNAADKKQIDYLKNECKICKTLDDENHRANYCSEFQKTNRLYQEKKIDFSKVFSENTSELKSISKELQEIWDISYNQNSMKS